MASSSRFCRTQRPYFSEHLDGVPLPAWRGFWVRFHLAICPECKRYQRSLVAARDAVGALRDLDVDPTHE